MFRFVSKIRGNTLLLPASPGRLAGVLPKRIRRTIQKQNAKTNPEVILLPFSSTQTRAKPQSVLTQSAFQPWARGGIHTYGKAARMRTQRCWPNNSQGLLAEPGDYLDGRTPSDWCFRTFFGCHGEPSRSQPSYLPPWRFKGKAHLYSFHLSLNMRCFWSKTADKHFTSIPSSYQYLSLGKHYISLAMCSLVTVCSFHLSPKKRGGGLNVQ